MRAPLACRRDARWKWRAAVDGWLLRRQPELVGDVGPDWRKPRSVPEIDVMDRKSVWLGRQASPANTGPTPISSGSSPPRQSRGRPEGAEMARVVPLQPPTSARKARRHGKLRAGVARRHELPLPRWLGSPALQGRGRAITLRSCRADLFLADDLFLVVDLALRRRHRNNFVVEQTGGLTSHGRASGFPVQKRPALRRAADAVALRSEGGGLDH